MEYIQMREAHARDVLVGSMERSELFKIHAVVAMVPAGDAEEEVPEGGPSICTLEDGLSIRLLHLRRTAVVNR